MTFDCFTSIAFGVKFDSMSIYPKEHAFGKAFDSVCVMCHINTCTDLLCRLVNINMDRDRSY